MAIEQLRQVVDSDPARFAGLSTNGSAHVTVHLLNAAAAAQPDLRRIRQTAKAAGITLTVVHQRRNLDELTRVKRAVMSDQQLAAVGSARVIGARVDPDTNSVVVRATGDTASLTGRMQQLYGDTVRIQPTEEPFYALGRFNDRSPFYGGDRIGNPSGVCTYGFSLTNLYGIRYGITAGHCWPEGSGVSVTRSTGGTNNLGEGYDAFGTVQFRRFGNGAYDNELIGGRDYGGRIWVNDYLYDNSSDSQPVHEARASCIGCTVYFNGSFTGRRLAVVGNIEDCMWINNVYSCGLWGATSADGRRICQEGDSGGPVFAYDGRGGVIAVGIITACYPDGRTGIYTDIPSILRSWQSTITTG
ncbi:hypothetical protein Daura_23215 [Dactylosporangium aurantiacum]|uniref:Peptidase S1 domain-containing protein n=1 Tax=Dactylosporangium aurantiacum TaxID=35754 RepID=A0A9Q9INB5_9ACTN|nr:S1 family peptidase [Dactylosporangium aurantiacum]UWZ58821.1 hypothetical protein Daura_23215 [Dactylosporangium aurantiacum]